MIKVSKKQSLILQWLSWHFLQMPEFLLSVWKNYIVFVLDFFSAPLLLKTLLSPWKRYSWAYPKGFVLTEYANTFISNTFSRIIGALCRIVLIICSVIALLLVLLIGVTVIFFWILLPCITLILVIFLYGL